MPALTDIAVVIPAGPGERAWRSLLPRLGEFGQTLLSCVERDESAAEVGNGVTVVAGRPGRGHQLNAGAAACALPWLLFLHADSRPGDAMAAAVEAAPDGDYLGYFDLRFYDGPGLMALNTVGVWLRSRVLGLPFGDQGLLVRRCLFERLGGFDETLDCGEDHALVWTARKAGVPIRPLRATLATSARRYAADGWWRVTRRHVALTWSQARSGRLS